MRAAKGRSFAFFFVALSLLVASSAFASIPRTALLDPPAIDRYTLAAEAVASAEVVPLHEQLARAARVSWPIETLPETRVGVSELFTPLEHPRQSELSRALHHAYAHLNGEIASDQTFASGDPVNGADPRGERAIVSKSGVIVGIRPDGTKYSIPSGTDPVNALRMLESDADIRTASEQEDLLTRAGIRVPLSSEPRPGETLLDSGKPNYRRYIHRPSEGTWAAWVKAAFVATTPLPPKTREQEIVSGAVQLVSAAAMTAGPVTARVKGGVGVGEEPVFVTRAGVQVGVNGYMDAAYGTEQPPLPVGVAPFEQYKRELAMDMAKPIVTDPELAKIMDDLYREDATMWSGSTADAVRHERLNGQPVGGSWHSQKAEEALTRLLSWMRLHPEMSSDRAAAEVVYRDLKHALHTPHVRSGTSP